MIPMKPIHSQSMRNRERGQTIIIAMVVLGVLLILGIVFLGIIDRSAKSTHNLGNRSAANDLSEAGIRYAHSQLLSSQLGADWRGVPTVLSVPGVNATPDPDVYYLRPMATLSDGVTPLPIVPGGSQIDLGGPDGLGPFFRVNYLNGRSLIRVRYAPSDANIFSNSPVGPLRRPGLARNYIIIEAVGREGLVNAKDPTTQNAGNAIQYRNFNQEVDFRAALGMMKQGELKYPFSQVNRAFVSIGIIETAKFITNKYNVSRAADIGIPAELGAMYPDGTGIQQPVAQNLPSVFGSTQALYNLGPVPASAGQIEGGGSVYSNASVVLHGNIKMNLNKFLGDQFDVAGVVKADAGAQLEIVLRDIVPNGTTWAPAASTMLGNTQLDSQSPSFTTVLGTFRDGNANPDLSGNPRGVGSKGVPSMEVTDAETGENRYVLMTADSGFESGNGNSGLFAHGSGVFVSNPSDLQGATDEVGRAASGSEDSLVYDWLNQNNGQKHSGWKGYLYVPVGAVYVGSNDGFYIQRNSKAPAEEAHWRYINGADTNSSFIRYRVGLGTDGYRHIVNSFTPANLSTPATPINVNGALSATDYDKGPVFNGVIYFQGNARVRGIIPTDVQITLVSNATIYIEGNITKGVTANGLQPGEGYSVGQLIHRPSKSMMMLMAKDYVTVNTTQFVAPSPNQEVEPVNDTPNSNGYNPIRVRTGGSLVMDFDFVRDPNGPAATANNPSTTRPYEFDYVEAGSPANKIPSNLIVAHTMDDGPAPATFFQWDVNTGGPDPSPYFFLAANNTASSYIPGLTPTQTIPEYGLGTELDQRYPKFEQRSFTLIDPTTSTMSADGQRIIANGPTGKYSVFAEGVNELMTRQVSIGGAATNDYILGRMALAPHDIRIEAAIYAEEGSFFVIPGPWFNPNPNDRRDTYLASAATKPERDAIRFENFGAWDTMPFYGEPLDMRIVISGAVSENMPPPASIQAEWLKKWGWIPDDFAATGHLLPKQHVPAGYTASSGGVVPNLTITYDPALATARSNGFVNDNSANTLIRVDSYGRPLPPLPRLPVSPVLAYFGEVH